MLENIPSLNCKYFTTLFLFMQGDKHSFMSQKFKTFALGLMLLQQYNSFKNFYSVSCSKSLPI
jgi:hypothetical protein